MAHSPKTKAESEAVAEVTTAIEADAVATDADGTWPIEDESAQAEDQAEVQPAGGITVTITGPKQGRWRAGRHFSADPTVIGIDTLTEDELEALRGDPLLSIVVG